MADNPNTAAQPGAPPQQVTGTQTAVNVPPAPTVANPNPQPAPAQPPAPATPQPPTNVPAAGQPAGIEPDFERKFKGLQAVHQSLTEDHKNLKQTHDALTQQLAEAQTRLDATRGELDSLKQGKLESENLAASAQEELADYRLWERKLNAIRTQAPNLLPFEKNIIVDLPVELENPDPAAMTEDQLKVLDNAINGAIADFAKVMESYIKDTQTTAHAGVVPTSSPGRTGDDMTLEALYDNAVAKAGTPEGDQLMEQYAKLAEQDEKIGGPDGEGMWRPPA